MSDGARSRPRVIPPVYFHAALMFMALLHLLTGRLVPGTHLHAGPLRWLGLPVTLLAAVGNGLAVTVFYVAVAPLVPALHSVWFLIHIVAAAISGAAFNIGAAMSVLAWRKRRAGA